jgi:hypothetical protein
MAKTRTGNGRGAGPVKGLSQVRNPRWGKRARDSKTLAKRRSAQDKRQRWGVNIADPLKKPKDVSVEKIRRAMRSYYK